MLCLEELFGFLLFFFKCFLFPKTTLSFFFFFVTCSWFVLNSANDFSKILALSCLALDLLCGLSVWPFRISFLFVVLGYLLILGKVWHQLVQLPIELSTG